MCQTASVHASSSPRASTVVSCVHCVGSCVYVAVCDRTVGPAVTSELCLQRVERVECMQQRLRDDAVSVRDDVGKVSRHPVLGCSGEQAMWR